MAVARQKTEETTAVRRLRRLAFTLSQTTVSQRKRSVVCTHKNDNNCKILTAGTTSASTCLSDDDTGALMPLKFRPFNETTDRRQFLDLIGERQHGLDPHDVAGGSALPKNSLEDVIIIEDRRRQRLCATATLHIEPKFIHNTACVGHVMDVVIMDMCREYGIAAPLLKRLKDIARQKKCYKLISDCKSEHVSFFRDLGFEVKEATMSIAPQNAPKPKLPSGCHWRFLQEQDYDSNFLPLLAQLTAVGHVSQNQFKRQFGIIKRAKNKSVVVIERRVPGSRTIVATAALFIESKVARRDTRCGHIEDVVVDAGARGLGLGLAVVYLLLQLAVQENCFEVVLDCSEKNVPFYERCGFSRAGACMRLDI